MDIRLIKASETLAIRHEVLWPTKDISFCILEGDELARHYGVYIKDELVCVASVFFDKNSSRLRKFATLKKFQNQGIGTKLLEHIIIDLKLLNIDYFWCDAREDAILFYKKFKMKQEGLCFDKSGLSYVKMYIKFS